MVQRHCEDDILIYHTTASRNHPCKKRGNERRQLSSKPIISPRYHGIHCRRSCKIITASWESCYGWSFDEPTEQDSPSCHYISASFTRISHARSAARERSPVHIKPKLACVATASITSPKPKGSLIAVAPWKVPGIKTDLSGLSLESKMLPQHRLPIHHPRRTRRCPPSCT